MASAIFNASQAARKRGLRLGRAGVLPSERHEAATSGQHDDKGGNLLPGCLTSACQAFGPTLPPSYLVQEAALGRSALVLGRQMNHMGRLVSVKKPHLLLLFSLDPVVIIFVSQENSAFARSSEVLL